MEKDVINKPEYNKGFDILSNNNTEYTESILLSHIKDIIKEIPNRRSMLDIGPGNGKLSRIYSYFNSITAIEPNKEYYKRLCSANIPNLKIYNNFWEETELKEKFDLCLCSHVLYYVPKEEWSIFIEKINKYRSDNRKMIITLASAKGDTCKFPAKFSDEICDFESLKQIMEEKGYDYDESLFKSDINVHKNELDKLCKFLLLPYINFLDNFSKTMEYFEKNRKRDYYSISNYTGLLIYPK